MLRYRCPHCSHLLLAHALRAGKKSVCSSCLKSHTIPADRTEWLNEVGEPLMPRREAVAESLATSNDLTPPPAAPTPERVPEPAAVAVAVEARATTPEVQEPPPTPEPFSSRPKSVSPTAETPPPTTAPALLTPNQRPAAEPIGNGEVVVQDALFVQTQADIAAALTEALTRRMRPPRQPRRDLRLSTASWLIFTGLAVVFLLLTLFTTANYSKWAFSLGILEMFLGYAWIISLTAQRDPQRGIACAVPPVTLYYLGQWKYAKFRPLRFVLTGVLLAGIAYLAPRMSPTTRSWVGSGSPPASQLHSGNPANFTKLEQLRDYRDRKSYDKLIELLRVLTMTDAVLSEDSKNQTELAAEMKSLCSHPDSGVKVEAMAAYARWGGDDARAICLDALGKSEDEKIRALKLLPKWKNTDAAPMVANAVAALIARPGNVTNKATTALEEIGGVAAEEAALDLLFRGKDQSTQLVALDILEKVGGEKSVTQLRGFINSILDQAIKVKTLETIELIQNRPKKKK